MGYPQTKAVEAIRHGQEFWRLFTPLESSGDIYESEVSSRAIVIGPESDIAQAEVTYYDVQNANIANCASVSVDKPFIGRLDALASQTYQTGDKARILITPKDLVPPPGFADEILPGTLIVPPNIDLLFYLNEQPSFIAPRSNRVHLFEQLPSLAVQALFLVPFYGRRFADVTVRSLGFVGQPPIFLRVSGVNFSNILGEPAPAANGHQIEELGLVSLPAPILFGGEQGSVQVTNRAFDYLAVSIESDGGVFPSLESVVTHIVVSDKI